MTTIKDVAKKAGVSPSTVSRVIKGNQRISEATISKVKKVMEELNYFPNTAARTLITNQTYKIGLVLKGSEEPIRLNPFYINVLLGISEECNQHGYGTQTTVSNNMDDLKEEVFKMIKQRMVDAFILLYSKNDDPIKQMLMEENMPFIVIGKPTSDSDYKFTHIDNNNVLASENLTQHVINQGVDEILFITEKGNFEVSKDRVKGFEKIVSQHNINYQIIETNSERESILSFLQGQQARLKDPNIKQAIISLDAMLHLAILSVLYELNIEIPNDILTATFNDSYLTEIASPPQTCIDIKPRLLGQQAGNAILKILNKREQNVIELVIIDTELVIRKSTQR